ncbi:MAG TPA: aminoglycoside phosphotransferase family protein [Chthonomonadaceae bacterium]|nr:aminoglycoside phosphotransferase family protein [Chthonomonadaceae bacterium]
MSVFIPASLQNTIGEFGEEGAEWLNSLPERIAALEREWGLRAGPAFDHAGACSWIAPVTLESGDEAILKIGLPHEEARFEADALRFLDGQGAVCLLRASDDGFSLLLERCLPGTDLWSLREDEADAVVAALLPRLWREPGPNAPFIALTDIVARWCEELPREAPAAGYDVEMVAEAIARGRELAASQPQQVFLHGDFNPGNVLAAQREPWLVIDPKPIVGDPAYDFAQWLGNRYDSAIQSADPVSVFRRQIDRFAERLALDPARIAGWAFVKALGWEFGPEMAALFHKVAQAW